MLAKSRTLARSPRTSDLSRLFLAETRTIKNARPTTMAAYTRALGMFEPYAPEHVEELGREHLVAYTTDLIGRGLKPHSINDYQRPVWTFCAWLFCNDYIERDISRKVPKYRIEDWSVTRRTASEDDHKLLVANALARAENPLRNAAIVETLWSTGLRRSELCALQMRDLDLDAGAIAVTHGKGGKPRVVGVGGQARYALERYFAVERGYEDGPVFLSTRTRRALTGDGMKLVILRLADAAGIHVAAHDFRRATASRLLSAGVELDVVQHQLGHARGDGALTLVYGAAGRTRRSLESFHSVDQGVRQMRSR